MLGLLIIKASRGEQTTEKLKWMTKLFDKRN